jgi:hypothetical protein
MQMALVLPVLAVLCFAGEVRSAEGKWKPYTSKEGRFSILWPGEPEITHEKHPKAGMGMTRYQAKSPGSSIDLLFLDVTDLPADRVKNDGFEGTMKAVKDWIATGTRATVVSEEKVSVGKSKHPGKDFVLHLPDRSTYIRLRACLVGERLYALVLVAPKGKFEDRSVGQLFESLTPSE